jgi:effector-binding domain-containing protein
MIYKIGDFSRLCRITVRTLRYYDEIGLLKPVRVDQFTGYRYYSIEQLPELNHIAMLKSIGLSLDDINGLVHNGMPVDHIKQLLQVKKSEIQERLNQDSLRLHQVDVWLDKISKEGVWPTDIYVKKKDVPALRVISKREIGTYEETSVKLLEELRQYINLPKNREGVTITGPVMMLSYDEEYKEKDADIEMAIPISGEISANSTSFEVKTLPECEVISVIHKGSYYNIDKAYARIFEYAEEHSLKLVVPLRELYLKDVEEVSEDELLTEIQCPFEESRPE